MKKQNGITLIALVITIIVLLILAGVSIATLSGENGIVTKAKEAAQKTEEGEKKEQEDLSKMEDWINDAAASVSFPYGVLYTMDAADGSKYGMVMFSNGAAEMYGIEGSLMVLDEYAPAGTCKIDGNKITITGEDVEFVLSEDYSTVTIGSATYNKTTTTVTQCTHNWTQSENTEVNAELHECSKCDVYGIHDDSNSDNTCDDCSAVLE